MLEKFDYSMAQELYPNKHPNVIMSILNFTVAYKILLKICPEGSMALIDVLSK